MEQSILLEADTNELEILVFKLGATPFGINVAKVREIIQPCKTIAIPNAPDAIKGSFKIRPMSWSHKAAQNNTLCIDRLRFVHVREISPLEPNLVC